MSKNSKSAWESGVTLSKAIELFSDEGRFNEYMQLEQLNSIKLEIGGPQKINLKPILPVREEFEAMAVRHIALPGLLQEDVLKRLKDGSLVGFGFQLPRVRNDAAILINHTDWDTGSVNWANSYLFSNGREFEEVRVVESRTTPTAIQTAGEYQETAKQPGRPPLTGEIRDAIRRLRDNGQFIDKPLKANYENVRNVIRQNNCHIDASDRGPSDETIRRVIKAELDQR